MTIPFVIVVPFATVPANNSIWVGREDVRYPSGNGGGGGGSVVAGAVEAVDELTGAADGGDGDGPEVVSDEEMVLGAGAGNVGVDITTATSGGEKGGPGGVGGEETVLGAGAGAE
jgi:hypothetical protein